MKNWLGASVTAIFILNFQMVMAADNNHIQLKQAVESYLFELLESQGYADEAAQQRVEVIVGYMDPRLTLPGCSEALDMSLNGNRQAIGKVQVRVQCRGMTPWSKYVPAEVRLFKPILVASESLRRGSILASHHFELREMELSRLRRTPVTHVEDALGMELKYSLTAGAALALEGLEQPTVIERGDQVQLVAETNTLRIKQQGEALQDGAVGKLISVRNNSSEIVVQAVVVSAGKVKVQL